MPIRASYMLGKRKLQEFADVRIPEKVRSRDQPFRCAEVTLPPLQPGEALGMTSPKKSESIERIGSGCKLHL
jgi:hypothetical protein